MRLNLPDVAATEALGAALAASRPPRAVVYLHGDLGAGKSTLARAVLRALGVRGAIRSPTYTLIEPYRLDSGDEALHLDLYRIAAVGELEFLGLDALAPQAALWLIEWPERGGNALPQADLRVDLAVADEGRVALLGGATAAGLAWLDQVRVDPNLAHFPAVDSR
jgi:tRNA threonylcarbamoyladenosine biosynthesis protein TsaE